MLVLQIRKNPATASDARVRAAVFLGSAFPSLVWMFVFCFVFECSRRQATTVEQYLFVLLRCALCVGSSAGTCYRNGFCPSSRERLDIRLWFRYRMIYRTPLFSSCFFVLCLLAFNNPSVFLHL